MNENNDNFNFAILIVALAALIIWVMGWGSDFTVSVDPNIVVVEQNYAGFTTVKEQNYEGFTTAKIESRWLYNKDIILNADMPSSINVYFEPQSLDWSKSLSTVTIFVDEKTPPGIYPIYILASGADGKQHMCRFNLKVYHPLPELITYPSNGAIVYMNGNATGIAPYDLHGQIFWIVIYDGFNYFPQGIPPIQFNEWQLPIHLGDKNNTGQKYEIIAVLADSTANATLASFCPNGDPHPMNSSQVQYISNNISVLDRNKVIFSPI